MLRFRNFLKFFLVCVEHMGMSGWHMLVMLRAALFKNAKLTFRKNEATIFYLLRERLRGQL